jgi:hypothetical protein
MDGIPPPLDDDDDDVAWALQTAAVQWQRNAHADAVVWLHRAVDAAISAGKPERAHGLTVAAQELTQNMAGAAGGAAAAAEPVSIGDRVSLSMDVEFAPPSEPVFEIPRRPPPPRPGALPPPRPAAPPPPRPASSLPLPKPPPPPRAAAAAAAPIVRSPPPAPPPPAFPPVPVDMPAPQAKRPSSKPPAARYSRPPDVFEPLPERLKKSSQPPPPPTPPPPSLDPDSDNDRAAFPYSQPPPPLDTSLGETIDALLSQVSDASARLGDAESLAPDSQPTLEARRPSEAPPGPAAAAEAAPAAEPARPAETAPAADAAPAAEPASPPSHDAAPDAARESIPPLVEGVSLADVRGLQDLPADAQAGLAHGARIEALGPDEEIGGFAVALVLEGDVRIMPSIADVACAFAAKGEVVFTTGSLEDGVMLRVVAGDAGARVAVWEPEALVEATASCPWVADELRLVADRYQALAGAMMGAMGDRLDDALRSMVTSRCDVRLLLGGEVLLEAGKPLDGMYIVGAGRLELVVDGEVVDELGPGDFLFTEQILAAGAAPSTARAGKTGALLLFAQRMTAHELLVSVPPLLEILAG